MTESTGERRALLVGVGRYDQKSELPQLNTPQNDVQGLARVLRDPERCRFTDVREIQDPDAQRLSVQVESLFASAAPEDLVLFYFSGHGMLSPRGGLHLCATNTDRSLLVTTSLSLGILNQIMNSKPLAQVVVVLDCCFSGAAEFSFKGDLQSLVTSDLGQGQGKYVITSSSAIEVSRARPGERYSVFTKWLIEGLETDAPDADENGKITIDELYRYVKESTVKEEPNQVPQHYEWSIKPGSVVIAYSKRAGKAKPAAAAPDPQFLKAVEPLLASGRIIPFLGTDIFGSGALSPYRISTALADIAGLAGQADLATAAEYLEWLRDDRQLFLEAFRAVLEQQSSEVDRSAIHDFVLSIRQPPLIISATYDLLLEHRLDESGIPYTLVAHILSSRAGEQDGKILIIRRGRTETVDICRADQLVLPSEDDLIIYKVLGSPFLVDYNGVDPDLDTVVVTESDHLTFVGRLENQHTRVPDAFSIPFHRGRLLFLGYSLDLWHYRLVLRVFGRARDRLRRSYAIRQPTSQMEELYWQRLGPDMIKGDPEQFAERYVKTLLQPAGAAT